MSENRLTRREFIKDAAIASAAVATAGMFGARPLAAAPIPSKWDYETDVVVVGGGGSGVSAAISAQEAGAKVIVLENAPYLGGNSSRSVGSVEACLSGMQKKLGVVDTPESMMKDAGTGSNKELLRVMVDNSGATIDWLVSLGVELRGPFEYPHQHSVPRMHMLYPNTSAWPKVLGPLMEKRGITVMLGTPGRRLYTDDKGGVIGVMAQETGSNKVINILAKRAVVLTGDGSGSKEWRSKFTEDPILLNVRATQPYNDAGVFYMALAAGADITDLNSGISASFRDHAHVLNGSGPSVGPNDIGPGGSQSWMPYNMYQAGAIIVNTDGKRYVNEQASTLGVAVEKQPGRVGFIVFDKPVADIFNKWPMVVSSLPGIGEKSGWGGWCSVDDLVFRGNIQVANTLDEVVAKVAAATKLQISASALKDTIEKWNGYAASGKDPEFGRTTFGLDALKGAGIKAPPYYIQGPCAAQVQGQRISLIVDTKLRVYDFWGKPIPRLYAAGNLGSNRGGVVTGHGGQMGWAFTSGRLVGKIAAGEAPLT